MASQFAHSNWFYYIKKELKWYFDFCDFDPIGHAFYAAVVFSLDNDFFI